MKDAQRSSRGSVASRVTLGLLLAATLGAIPGESAAPPVIELVESFPIETDLDHPHIRDAHIVWQEMIAGATHALDFAEFYASNAPESRLETIIVAIEAAADRGVGVRFLAEKKFAETYPQTLARLAAREGIAVREFDVAALMGGVLHAKYFLVDGREAFVGSQNFDWRALTHIQELGVRIRDARLVQPLADLFATDWALAGGADPEAVLTEARSACAAYADFPVALPYAGDTLRITPVFSPRDWLSDAALWDLPRIIALIDGAQSGVRLQLLTYRAVNRDGEHFGDLENALRRAAARGVPVQMLLADWSRRAGTIEGLQSLQQVANIEVRLATIPPWSGGFIPYARVIHAKYLVVDGERAWLGTSNWERDYFFASRNVGIIMEGAGIPAALDRFFRDGWEGPYARPVDPESTYVPPRIGQ